MYCTRKEQNLKKLVCFTRWAHVLLVTLFFGTCSRAIEWKSVVHYLKKLGHVVPKKLLCKSTVKIIPTPKHYTVAKPKDTALQKSVIFSILRRYSSTFFSMNPN